MTQRKNNYRFFITTFLIGLFAVLGLIDFSILSYEKKRDLEENTRKSAAQLQLVGRFLTDPFLKDDYSLIGQFFKKWGEENDEIVTLMVYTPEKSLIAEYLRKTPASDPYYIEHNVKHDGEPLLTIRMEVDLDTIRQHGSHVILILSLFLVATSALIMSLAGLALWRIVQKTAIIPLRQEIEKRNDMEGILRKNEERYRSLFNESNDAIFIYAAEEILEVNNRACELLGYPHEELIRKKLSELHPSEARGKLPQILQKVLEKGTASFEDRYQRADGTIIDVDISASLIDPNTKLIQGIVRNITERKHAALALERNYHLQRVISNVLQQSMMPGSLDEQLQSILEEILTTPFLVDQSKGSIHLYSPEDNLLEMRAKKGLSPSISKHCGHLSLGTCLCGIAAEKKTFLHRHSIDESHSIVVEGMEPHGHYCVPILHHQELLGVISLYLPEGHDHDPSEEKFLHTIADTVASVIKRKRAEAELIRYKGQLEEMVVERTEELIAAKEVAENASRTKTEFLANISHELKTPLHGILGFAKLGNDRHQTIDRAKLGHYFKDIYDCGQRLLKLLNDLLEISRLETGKMPYTFIHASLGELVLTVINELSALSKEKRINIKYQRPGFSDTADLDVTKITQVLRNLLANALKFSEQNTTIYITITDETENLLLSVIDSGIGVPREEQKSIFEMFVQGSRTKTGAGGTGLGLAISKDIITAHKGHLWVEDNPEGGAIFRFILPKSLPHRDIILPE